MHEKLREGLTAARGGDDVVNSLTGVGRGWLATVRAIARRSRRSVHNWASWEAAAAEYRRIDRPALLVYGDHDWSRPGERAATASAIPRARVRVIKDAGHFLSLDAPEPLAAAILAWARFSDEKRSAQLSP